MSLSGLDDAYAKDLVWPLSDILGFEESFV
jgi:hypothetical protein